MEKVEKSWEEVTFGEALDKVRAVLVKVGNESLKLNDSRDTTGAVHGLSKVPIAKVRSTLNESFKSLSAVADFNKLWSETFYHDVSRAKGELAQQNKRIDQVKQALSKASATCAREDPFGPSGFRLSKQLQLGAENAGLQWAEDIPLDGSAFAATGQVAPLTIYSKTFQIDVKFQLDSAVTEAKLSNVDEEGTEEAADASVNADIERLLFDGKLDEIERSLRKLMELEELDGKLVGFKLKDSLRGFEEDILTVQKCEIATGSTVAQRLTLGHGLVRRAMDGLRIRYHANASTISRLTRHGIELTEDEAEKLDGLFSASLGAEESETERTLAMGAQGAGSVQSMAASLPLEFSFASENTATVKAVYVLTLDPPIVCSVPHAASLASLANPESNETPVPWTEKGTRLQSLLSPDVFAAEPADVVRSSQLADGTVISMMHSRESRCLGARVWRVPLLHPRDVLTVLRLLRQQAIFNDLFLSCCRQDVDTMDVSRGPSALNAEVVISEPPSFLQLTFSSPNRTDSLTILGITIGVGGNINATLQGDSDWCNDITATRLLRACRDVPQAIFYMRQSAAPLAG